MINSFGHEVVEATCFTSKKTQIHIKDHMKKEFANFEKHIGSNYNNSQEKFDDRIGDISTRITTLTDDLANTDVNIGIRINSVKEPAIADIVQAGKEVTKDATQQVMDFAVKDLQDYTNKLLPNQLKANEVTFYADIFVVNKLSEDIEDQHK